MRERHGWTGERLSLQPLRKRQGFGKLEHEDCSTFWFFLNIGLTDVELQQGSEPFGAKKQHVQSRV